MINNQGNAAAMYEALLKCRDIALQWQVDEAAGVAGTTDKPSARSAAEAVIDMESEINAALSAPPRNCDVGTADEQYRRFYAFCRWSLYNHTSPCNGCPLTGVICCKLSWSQLPYESEVKHGNA